jgi:sulfhydrogenase subunit delta
MKYLGIDPIKPRIGVFDFTGCEGCELQLANKEDTLIDFINAISIVSFREISTSESDDYDIALVEGSITRKDEVQRLNAIRDNAKVLVALGSCACFGGVARQKNVFSEKEVNRIVYGDSPKETLPTRSVKEIVPVDLEIPGCPVSKPEVENIVQHLVWNAPFKFPVYPVCVECKQRFNICMFEKGQLCMGPITRAGCDAACPAGGLGCWGCRGPVPDPNYPAFFSILESRGFSGKEINERLNFFGGFADVKWR